MTTTTPARSCNLTFSEAVKVTVPLFEPAVGLMIIQSSLLGLPKLTVQLAFEVILNVVVLLAATPIPSDVEETDNVWEEDARLKLIAMRVPIMNLK